MAFEMPEGRTNEPKLYTRDREVQLFILTPPEEGNLCFSCDALIACGMFAWDHRITNYPDSQPFEIGEDRFSCWRHADGELCEKARDGWNVIPKSRCPKCKQFDSCKTDLQAYGNLTKCTTPGCDYENWYDIGD